ncbi:MFS transporter (plasmid) [Rhodococcus sp. 2G]|uniref:MFS transporter n=1 Tax=Rhodococcus sp. 2G TaxID=1570939 RepID=UPI000903B40E|nr:MFS transporter [Rhodococcus sp. 2G]APE12550.1 MFS transporter [Rhodococcus sp. 2G]
MPAWLLALAFSALVFYTDDYVIAGVLPEISADLDVSTGTAGQLVTVFSLVVAVTAPIAAVLTARLAPRQVLTVAATAFGAANIAASLSPTFGILMAARIVAAAAAAAATPSLFALAARLAPPERVGRYVAVVALGVTGAIAVGVPVGTWISTLGSWRTTFAFMAGLGLLVALALAGTLRANTDLGTPIPLADQLRTLAAPAVSLGLAANIVLMFGSMMMLTYLAPFALDTAHVDASARGPLFAVSGIAGMVGIWAGGRATDRLGPDTTLAIGVGVFVTSMIALYAVWVSRPVPPGVLYPLVAIWGAAAFWNSPAVQARLHMLAGPVSTQALALNTSGTYLGVAVGGAVGGVVLDTFGNGALPIVAACAGIAALLLFRVAQRYTSANAVT